uniref:Uncharacterized protein n=1 Tax=Plectus sambesii TaxID=2011161 RepID=A0A914VDJ3_9BILA
MLPNVIWHDPPPMGGDSAAVTVYKRRSSRFEALPLYADGTARRRPFPFHLLSFLYIAIHYATSHLTTGYCNTSTRRT